MMNTAKKPYIGPSMEGSIARWYAKNTRGDGRAYRECASSVAARVGSMPRHRVLEVAPGPGYVAVEIAKLGYEVSGLDISKSFVRIAKDVARGEGVAVDFRHGNASAMPYPDGSFDFVFCRAAFKNFSDPSGALDEIYRVLAPGGQASILDLRKDSSPSEIRDEVAKMHLSTFNAWFTKLTFRFFLIPRAYTVSAIERLAIASRFGGCEVRTQGVEFDLRLIKPA